MSTDTPDQLPVSFLQILYSLHRKCIHYTLDAFELLCGVMLTGMDLKNNDVILLDFKNY